MGRERSRKERIDPDFVGSGDAALLIPMRIYIRSPSATRNLLSESGRITRAHRWAVEKIVSSVREAGPWRSDISERRFADDPVTDWGL